MCGLKVRFTQSPERRGVFAYSLKVEVVSATDIPSKIFVYHQAPAGIDGNTFAEFDHVATPVDFQEIPEDAASETVPWFRTDKFTGWFRNVSDLNLAKQMFVDDIAALQRTYDTLTSKNNFMRQSDIEFVDNGIHEESVPAEEGSVERDIADIKTEIQGKLSKDALDGVEFETNDAAGIREAVKVMGNVLGAKIVKSIALVFGLLCFSAYGAGFSGEHYAQLDLDENPIVVTNVTFDGLVTDVDMAGLLATATNYTDSATNLLEVALRGEMAAIDDALSGKLNKSGDQTLDGGLTLTTGKDLQVGGDLIFAPSNSSDAFKWPSIVAAAPLRSYYFKLPNEDGTFALTAGTGHAGNLAALDSQGNPVDSGKSITNLQDKLTFDTAPKANSQNPVTSDGVKTAIDSSNLKAGFTSGIRLDNSTASGLLLYFRPRAFGMHASDTIQSITLHTSTSTANTSSPVYARLVKYTASSQTYVALSEAVQIQARNADIEFVFPDEPAVESADQYYRLELTTSSSETPGTSPINASLRVYYDQDNVRKTDCYFNNSLIVPVMSVKYRGYGNPLILNTDNCIGSGTTTYHTGSALNIQGECTVLTDGTITIQSWDQIRLASGQTLPEFVAASIIATQGNIIFNATDAGTVLVRRDIESRTE